MKREPSAIRRIEASVVLTLVGASAGLYTLANAPSGLSKLQAMDWIPINGFAALGIVIGIMVLNAVFVAGETALESLKPLHVRHLKELNIRASDRLQRLLDGRDRAIAACIFATHLCRVAMVLGGLLIAQGVIDWFGGSFFLAALVVAIPILLLNLVFELIPKSYAVLHPHRVCVLLYRVIEVTRVVFGLPALLVSGVAGLVTRRFGGKASFTIENQTEEEIKSLVETAEESGEMERDERELLHSVFEFTDTVAREVMTPRVDLDAMPIKSDPAEIVKLIQETGHSRIPLYEENDDQIVGIIHAKDLLMAMLSAKGSVSLRKLMRPALFVPENKDLQELLAEMRLARSQLAVVQDEFGGTAGIVTIEDIVEELVGEIVDEYDNERPAIEQVENGWLIDGKTHVDDVNSALQSEFDSEEFDTIGGYVFGLFGRQPKHGEAIDAEGFRFTIVETDGRRILRLKLERCDIPDSFEAIEA